MVGTFVLIYLIQSMDKKYKNKTLKNNFFDMVKYPILASAVVGLSIQYFTDSDSSISSSPAYNMDIFTEVPNF